MRAALALLPTGDYTRGFWLTNYSDLLDYLGRVTESEAAAHEALEIGRRRRDPTLEGMAWWSLSWVAAHRGDRPGFLAAIDAFERAAGSWIRPGQLVEYLGSTAEWLAMLGETERCTAFIARGRTAAAAADYPTPIELAEARLLAMHGDPDAAIELLERLDSGLALVPSNRPTRVILRALAELRRGDTGRALLLRDEARAAAAAMGVPDLLERHAQPVMRAFEAIADPSTGDVDAEGSTAAATLRMLGGFSVERAGAPCTPQPGHPATLVKLLALQGVMTVDAALDALWPDADLATGRARLRNLLNRLKQRAGELVVRDAETLRVHPSVVIDLDVFDRRAGAALAADPAERVGLARHAISLYTGELLPGDVYEDWALGPRERSKRRYLALVDVVADDAIARGDADEAVRLLDLGIAAEPLDEDRYSRMCAVLVEQGRIGTAREVAARAVATLAEIGEVADPRLRELVGR
jgi:DNA-binding SARP family transcriptional activator